MDTEKKMMSVRKRRNAGRVEILILLAPCWPLSADQTHRGRVSRSLKTMFCFYCFFQSDYGLQAIPPFAVGLFIMAYLFSPWEVHTSILIL